MSQANEMTEAKVYDSAGQEKEKVALSDAVFGVKPNTAVLHQYVKTYLGNQRQGTHATKTRAEVSGGGKKPWRQKGTGRARAGSNTSPVWVRGGLAHGPKPRDYETKMPKKARRLALLSALAVKAAEGKVVLFEPPALEKPHTQTMFAFFSKLGAIPGRSLVLAEGKDDRLRLSCRNLPGVTFKRAAAVNAYDLLANDRVLLTKPALEAVQEALAG